MVLTDEQRAINKKISQKRWRDKNREKISDDAKAYYIANKAYINNMHKIAYARKKYLNSL